MPELPEVEIIKRGLQSELVGDLKILQIKCYRSNLRNLIPLKKMNELAGSSLLSIERRAKYLIFKTSGGYIVSHLGMSGTWRLGEEKATLKKHDHVQIYFSNTKNLILNDPRRFGYFDYVEDLENSTYFKKLGPEPLDPSFNAKKMFSSIRNRHVSIKAALLDQKTLVGVGNIYASESLYLAGINPLRASNKISLLECESILEAVRNVLSLSIEKGGSSISDFKNLLYHQGNFQNHFQVYDRENQSCLRQINNKSCSGRIRSKIISGRTTYYCPKCQK